MTGFKCIKCGSATAPYPNPVSVYCWSTVSNPVDNMFEDLYLDDMLVSCLLYLLMIG